MAKEYHYRIKWAAEADPLQRHVQFHVRWRQLDLDLCRAAAERFVGQHDFRAFTTKSGEPVHSTVRHVGRCEVDEGVGGDLTVRIEGKGEFLPLRSWPVAGEPAGRRTGR